jgi:hypothetical protein
MLVHRRAGQGHELDERREGVVWRYSVSAGINPDRSYNGYALWNFFVRDGRCSANANLKTSSGLHVSVSVRSN